MHSANLSSRSAFPKGLRGFTLPPSFFKFIWVSRGVCVVGGCHSTVKQRQPHLASRCSMVFKGANKVILSFVESCMHCESRHDFRHCRCRRLQSRNSRRQKKTNSSDGTEPKAWAPGSRLQFPTLKCSQICQMLSISSKFIKTLISLGQNMAKKTIGKDWEPCQVLALLSSLFN